MSPSAGSRIYIPQTLDRDHDREDRRAHPPVRADIVTLAAAGKDLNHLTPKDLAPVDEFHIGGRQATVAFAEAFGPRPGMRLLDARWCIWNLRCDAPRRG